MSKDDAVIDEHPDNGLFELVDERVRNFELKFTLYRMKKLVDCRLKSLLRSLSKAYEDGELGGVAHTQDINGLSRYLPTEPDLPDVLTDLDLTREIAHQPDHEITPTE